MTDFLLFSFCQNIDDAVAVPMAPRIAKDIGPFLPVTSEDTLTLVLETLAVVVQIDEGKWITEDLARSIVVAVLDVWMKNNKGLPIFFPAYAQYSTCMRILHFRSHLHLYSHRRAGVTRLLTRTWNIPDCRAAGAASTLQRDHVFHRG